MAIFLMLKWWYGAGWAYVLNSYTQQLRRIVQDFSIVLVLRTLLSPWKQMTSKVTLQNIGQAVIDNTISRLVGFIIRIFVLITALLMILAVSLFFVALLLAWAFIPLGVVALPFYGIITGMNNG